MGWLSNKINRDHLKPGDHIYSWRKDYLYVYAHHGIYVSEEKVIHFTQEARRGNGTGTVSDHSIFSLCSSDSWQNPCTSYDEPPGHGGGVISSCLDSFLSGGDLNLFEYGVSRTYFIAKVRGGTCTVAKSDPPEDVLHRAFYLLENGFGNYSLSVNNCEDFAIYCKTELYASKGRSGQAAFVSSSATGIVCTSVAYIATAVSGPAAIAGGATVYSVNRYVNDIGIRSDVVKMPVEDRFPVLPVNSPPHPSSIRYVNDIGIRSDVVTMPVEDLFPVLPVGSAPHPSSIRFLLLAYEELKQATNNFESASILGEDRFGQVFKGVLSVGTAVAIKRLTNGGQQGDEEFLVVVEMLSRLHHPNLLKLRGYYSGRDSSQNLLCYELVPNKSLEAWLHGPVGVNCRLDWDTRMMIALDAARGLAYLHEESQPCVIHGDFKASNILLEMDFHAKVAGFGLAKLARYVAPEHTQTGQVDVYNYGVVLLELLSGRRPVDMSQPSGKKDLVTWARSILGDKNQLKELADPSLGANFPMEDFDRVFCIAVACVASESSHRPTMGKVVESLIRRYPPSSLSARDRQTTTTYL